MTFYIKGRYVARGSRVKNDRTYYSVAIIQGTEPVQLGCSLNVFNQLEGYEENDEVIFRFTEHIANGRNGAFVSRYCVAIGEE